MNRDQLFTIVRNKINPQPDDLFMFTDPTYVYEEEWDDEMRSAKPFDEYIPEFIDGNTDLSEKQEFTQEDLEYCIDCLDIVRVKVGQQFG